MPGKVSERNFESAVEASLLAGGPDADLSELEPGLLAEPTPYYGEYLPGGYHKRGPDNYDRRLCLDPDLAVAFVKGTQPRRWAQLKERFGDDAEDKFVARLSDEIGKRGALEVLRKGLKYNGVQIDLVYFRPASSLNPETQLLYEGNVFSVIRQLHYSQRDADKSIDMVLFLNGIPLFSAELKNPLNGQTVTHAIAQYRRDRDPREPLLSFGRCLAHFAVDPELVFVTTKLEGVKTGFLPFNKGKFGGAGNPPDIRGFATRYLWELVWSKDSVLELIQRFIHLVIEEDEKGRKTGEKKLMFPRFHQLDAVRRLVDHAKRNGPGHRYLIQHSAGSGKSATIAWLAHQLSVLHGATNDRIFDSIVVITDRRVLDRQLQRTVRQFEQTLGVVENIDKTSSQLKDALELGKTIIVTTLQKFPVIVDEMAALNQKSFAVLIDEAHSSQAGEDTKAMKKVLRVADLEEAEAQDVSDEPDAEDRIIREAEARGPLANLSMFAFTATPKPKTLELFGTNTEGKPEPFSLYTMRQAIEEGFIMDVLENYTTYRTYWSLLKRIADDPKYDHAKASYLLRSFVDLHPHAVERKIEIIVEHFHSQVAHRVGGRAKAMIVTRSRLHAVRMKLALDAAIKKRRYPYRSLVAFSDTVEDGGNKYTEASMNGFSERQTAAIFKQDDSRFLVVAEKFQTGFDEPLLHTMYVDKRLSGVNAVQTLSRLNRVHPDKAETMVLDFANEAHEIEKAFQLYYEKTILSETTDPHVLYDVQRRLLDYEIYDESEVRAFAEFHFDPSHQQYEMYGGFNAIRERFEERAEDEQRAFKSDLGMYTRLYSFLAQVMRFADADLERLYYFARYLNRYLRTKGPALPVEVQQQIDIESFRIQETGSSHIRLDRGAGELRPPTGGTDRFVSADHEELLSHIIRELNEQFGTDFTDEDRVFIEELESRLATDFALEASVRANTPENARLTFDHVVGDRLQEMVETNFEFYKRVTDDDAFGRFFTDWLFERYRARVEASELDPMQGIEPRDVVRRAVDIIVEIAAPKRVILFGSAAKGTSEEGSDLDFVVVIQDDMDRHRVLRHLKDRLGSQLIYSDVVLVTDDELADRGHLPGTTLHNALLDGRIVYDAA